MSDGGDPDGSESPNNGYYLELRTNGPGGNLIAYRDWSTSTSWTLPNGLLKDGGRYYWRAKARDSFNLLGDWSAYRSFKFDALRLGPRKYYPMDSHALGHGINASVNLASGNLTLEQSDVNLSTATAPFSFVRTYNSRGSAKPPTVYLDDNNGRPANAIFGNGEDGWAWVNSSTDPAHVWAGSQSHYAAPRTGTHQHFFDTHVANEALTPPERVFVPVGSTIVTYAYLVDGDPTQLLQEVMLQFWTTPDTWVRAYWGSDLINFGNPLLPRTQISSTLPPKNQWVRLEVPAAALGLENKYLGGVAYTLFGGGAWWDKTMLGGGYLGHGWSFGTELNLDFINFVKLTDRRSEAGVIDLVDRDGGTHFYYDTGDAATFINEQGDSATLKAPNAGDRCGAEWQITMASKTVYCFLSTGDANNGTVDKIYVPQQPGQPGLDYAFSGGKLVDVLDATGTRKVVPQYGGSGLFAGMRLDRLELYVKDSAGSWQLKQTPATYAMTLGSSTYSTDDGFLKSVTDAAGHQVEYTYDLPSGDLTAITTPRGTVTTSDTQDFKTTFGYQAALSGEGWRRIASVNRAHNVSGTYQTYTTAYSYDAANRTTKATAPKGVATTGDPNDYVTAYKYSDKDNPIQVTDLAGKVSKAAWADNMQTNEIDRTGRRTDHTFDAEDRPLLTIRPVVDPDTGRAIKPLPGSGEMSTQGLKATYFSNPDLAPWPALTRQDTTVDFNWGTAAPDAAVPADNFSARWVGYIYSGLTTEPLTFYVNHDDGARLWVGGNLVVDDWNANRDSTATPVVLGTGWHSLVLEYRETGGGANVQLSWSWPSQARQVVPSTSLKPGWIVDESQYDAQGNRVRSIDADGNVTTYEYADPTNHRVTAQVDPRLNRTAFDYYSGTGLAWKDGLLKTKTMPGGGTATYDYFNSELYTDSANGLTNVRQTGFLKSVVESALPTMTCHAASVTACSHYDWRGNKVHQRDAKGDSYFVYDQDNRQTKSEALGSMTASDGSTFTASPNASTWTTTSYDDDGNRRAVVDSTITYTSDQTAFRFDDLNRMDQATDSWGGTTTYSYDADNFLLSKTSPAGSTSYTSSTDGLDRIASLTDTQSKTFSFTYDEEGRLTRTTYPNTTRVDYVYGGQGELISQQNLKTSPVSSISGFSYAYEATGQKIAEAGPPPPSGTDGRNTYAYDRDGRLEAVNDAAGTTDFYHFDGAAADGDSNRSSAVIGATTRSSAPGSWINIKGNWKLSANELVDQPGAPDNLRDKILYGQDFPQDVTVEAKMKFTAAGGVSGIIFRQNTQAPDATYFAARLDARNNTANLVYNGSTIYSTAFTVTTGTWYTLKVVLSGSSVTFYVNGSSVLSRTDLPTSMKSNYVGLKASLAETHFDDFKVTVGSQASTAVVDSFGWRTGSGEWGDDEGAISQRLTGTTQYTMATDPIADSSYTVEGRVRVAYDPAGRRHAGFVVDWDPATTTGYRVTHLDSNWVISKFVSGTETAVLSTVWDQGFSPSFGWQSVSINRNRSTGSITLVVDGRAVGSVTDSSITTGGAGFHAYQAKALFRDFRVVTGGTYKTYTYNQADQLTSNTQATTPGIAFDGQNDYVNTGKSLSQIGIQNTSFTMEGWAKPNSTSGQSFLVGALGWHVGILQNNADWTLYVCQGGGPCIVLTWGWGREGRCVAARSGQPRLGDKGHAAVCGRRRGSNHEHVHGHQYEQRRPHDRRRQRRPILQRLR